MADPEMEFFFELDANLFKKIVLSEATAVVVIDRIFYDDSGTIQTHDRQTVALAQIAGFEAAEGGLILRYRSGDSTYL